MGNNDINFYVDTDVLIRFLTGDDLEKQKAAAVIFERVSKRELILHAPDTVIADAVYVLSSPRLQNLSRPQIHNILRALVALSNFKVENKRSILEALSLFATTTLDFADAMLISRVLHTKEKAILSYDQNFDHIKDIRRKEP